MYIHKYCQHVLYVSVFWTNLKKKLISTKLNSKRWKVKYIKFNS